MMNHTGSGGVLQDLQNGTRHDIGNRGATRCGDHTTAVSGLPDEELGRAPGGPGGDIARSESITCSSCGAVYRVIEGIPILVPGQYAGPNNTPAEAIDREHLEYEDEATRRVARLLSGNRKNLSLDAGCGKGTYSGEFGENLVLLDANFFFVREAVKRCDRARSCFGVVADVRCLPFSTGTFDLVFSSNVIEHLPSSDVTCAIDEMKRTTREILQLDTPNEHGLVRLLKSAMARVGVYGGSVYQDESLRHQTEFSPAALRRLGFDVSGCIGWVTRKRIRLGPLWNL